MRAVAVLAVGMMAVMDNWAGLKEMREETGAVDQVNRIMESIQNRFLGALGEDIGKGSATASVTRNMEWSVQKLYPISAADVDGRFGWNEDDLKSFGIIPRDVQLSSMGIENFRIYLEYYRTQPFTTTAGVLKPGISTTPYDDEDTSSYTNEQISDLQERKARYFRELMSDDTRRQEVWLNVTDGLGALITSEEIGTYDSVSIFIVAHWGPMPLGPDSLPVRKLEIISSRRPYKDD
jgi:hypothetical protein